MSKKTLNESTIRRFMGLAGLKPTVSSNFLNENNTDVNEEAEIKEEGSQGKIRQDM